MKRAFFCLIALAGLASASVPAGSQSDGDALYDAAFDRWQGIAEPAYATYDARFTLVRGAKVTTRLNAIAYRRSDGRCHTAGVALDRRDRPDRPNVTKRCLSPAFAFTFIPQSGSDAAALNLNVPAPDPSDEARLKTIGAVRVRVRPYAIALAGTESANGKETVHLTLRPLREPNKHVLRDIWIDPATDGVVRLHGEATAGPNLFHVDFNAFYDEDATTQTLRRVEGKAKVQLLFVHASGDVSYELTNIAYPATLPASLFGGRE
ncbi:MAG: hypothetical protein WAJ85_08740 [Candidatus Baltobacteraceae bacterium]